MMASGPSNSLQHYIDVILPGMNDYVIFSEIKRNNRTKKTPVINLSGKSSPFDIMKGKLAGCDSDLIKPMESRIFERVEKKYFETTVGEPIR